MRKFYLLFVLAAALFLFPYFPAKAYANGYSYSRAITVDHTKVSTSDQSNFAVLVCFNGASPCDRALVELKSTGNGGHVQNVSGYDIIFASDRNGVTPLSFEKEKYDPATGEAVFWVKIPTLSYTSDAVIYAFYGNSGVSSFQGNAAGTWDGNFKAVYHFDQAASKWMMPTKTPVNPIINYGGGGWKDFQLEEPIVIPDPDDASNLIMFYSAVGAGKACIGRATAAVSDPTTWTEYASNPIICDISRRLDSVLLINGVYYLYSSDNDNSTVDLFTSADGFTFVKHPSSPVLTPAGQGRVDGDYVGQAAVLKDGDNWYMYYSYRNGAVVLPGVRYAISVDGVAWTKGGAGDVFSTGSVGMSDSIYIEWHHAQKIGSTYLISYEGYNGASWSANIAYSANPISGWTKSAANPVFKKSGTVGSFDRYQVATPAFFLINSTWYLFYQGCGSPGNYILCNWAMGEAVLTGDPLDATVAGVSDSTSGSIDLTATDTDSVAGQIGAGLSFDGVKSNAGSLVMPTVKTDDFTLETWINPSVQPQSNAFIIQNGADDGETGGIGYAFYLDAAGPNSKLVALFSNVTAFDSGVFLGSNVWYHVVLVRDSGTAHFYLNGVQTPNSSGAAPLVPSGRFSVAGKTGAAYFDGSIDEVRVSDIARSVDWIATEYNNQSSPSTFYALGGESSAPVVSEVTPVTNPSLDPTPEYIFNSTEAGTVTYDGGCASSATSSAVPGNNTIAFDALAPGNYASCTIYVTNGQGVYSNTLPVSSFTVVVRHASGSGTAYAPPPASVSLSLPVGGETYSAGAQIGVSWSSANGAFVRYRVSYSADNGNTWTVLSDGIFTNSYTWTIPANSTTQGLIKIEGLDDTGTVLATDTNDAVFIVAGTTAAPPPVAPPPPATDPTATGTYTPSAAQTNTPDINTDLGLSTKYQESNSNPVCASGSLIKGSLPAVYYCGADGKRYVFVNEKAYHSWYPDFSTVQTISDADMALIPLGGNITYRPGSRMVKIMTDPKVYAVSRGGILRWVTTEAVAIRLYGADWNKQIDDVPDSFFTNYTLGEPITE